LLFVEDYDYIVGQTRILIIISHLLMATGSLVLGILTLRKARTDEMVRKYFTTISIFFIGIALGRYVFILHDFFTPGLSSIDLSVASYLKRLAVIFTIGGLTSLTYLIETQFVTKTRKGFTIFGIITIITQLCLPYFISQRIQYIANPVLTILPFIVYIYLFKNSVGILKKQAGIILLGMAVLLISQMGFGLLEDLEIIDQITVLLIGQPFFLLGLIIIGYGFLRYNKE
jgi:hypothetical protein